jgi:hypothetical protein
MRSCPVEDVRVAVQYYCLCSLVLDVCWCVFGVGRSPWSCVGPPSLFGLDLLPTHPYRLEVPGAVGHTVGSVCSSLTCPLPWSLGLLGLGVCGVGRRPARV